MPETGLCASRLDMVGPVRRKARACTRTGTARVERRAPALSISGANHGPAALTTPTPASTRAPPTSTPTHLRAGRGEVLGG